MGPHDKPSKDLPGAACRHPALFHKCTDAYPDGYRTPQDAGGKTVPYPGVSVSLTAGNLVIPQQFLDAGSRS